MLTCQGLSVIVVISSRIIKIHVKCHSLVLHVSG